MSFLIGLVLSALYLRWPWHLAVLAPLALVEALEIWLWLRLRKMPPDMVAETLVGRPAEVVSECAPEGQVRVGGQIWGAVCDEGAARGSRVLVTEKEGIKLKVEPLKVESLKVESLKVEPRKEPLKEPLQGP